MKVRDLMTTELLEVSENDSLAVAAHRMTWAGCRHLPVTREGEVVGVLSERDLLAWRGEGRGLDGPQDRVGAAMSAPAVVAVPEDDLGQAAARMIARRIGCLPVVMHGRLMGMITSTDLLGFHVTQTFEQAPGRDVPAAAVMTPRIFTAHPHDPLLEAADLMVANRIRHLPVVDESGRLVGMLSERDLRTALGAPTEALENWPARAARTRTVGELMASPVAAVRGDQPMSQVITMIVNRGVGAVPVIDGADRPIGIVSYLDILRALRR